MIRKKTRFRAFILLGMVLALVGAACSSDDSSDSDSTAETVIVTVPGETITSIVEWKYPPVASL
jgi:ABC-type glycerol-3-phosphate transport system substrate-binding protein